jgi:hypothetical protein
VAMVTGSKSLGFSVCGSQKVNCTDSSNNVCAIQGIGWMNPIICIHTHRKL